MLVAEYKILNTETDIRDSLVENDCNFNHVYIVTNMTINKKIWFIAPLMFAEGERWKLLWKLAKRKRSFQTNNLKSAFRFMVNFTDLSEKSERSYGVQFTKTKLFALLLIIFKICFLCLLHYVPNFLLSPFHAGSSWTT
jgi:hypothetical protein